jgi:hypothetical protein
MKTLIKKYQELDSDEKEILFFLWGAFVLLGLLFSSYSNIYLTIPFLIFLGYFIYRLHIFKKKLEGMNEGENNDDTS